MIVDGARARRRPSASSSPGSPSGWSRADSSRRTATYRPLNAFAIGLLVLAISSMTHANEFLAAFAAGITVATVGPEVRRAFHHFGELVAELLKLAALLVFGALISTEVPRRDPRRPATSSRCS